jgi:hypothetical protein
MLWVLRPRETPPEDKGPGDQRWRTLCGTVEQVSRQAGRGRLDSLAKSRQQASRGRRRLIRATWGGSLQPWAQASRHVQFIQEALLRYTRLLA